LSVDPQVEMLSFYERELAYLREMGAVFAQRYPKIAARLQLGPSQCEDPHVERLLESFAFLTGRLHRDIAAEFPEITQALLQVLYPQLVAPVPSMAIAQFTVSSAEGKFTTGHRIPAQTPLIAESRQGHVCRFRTGAPITLWPVRVERLGFQAAGDFRFLDRWGSVRSVLRMALTATSETMADLEIDNLRLFVNGEGGTVSNLVALLLTRVRTIVLLPDGDVTRPVFIDKGELRQAGFADDEALLAYPEHAHKGYRLLQEYFAFPQKFRFFDLCGLDRAPKADSLEILFCLDGHPSDLTVNRDNLVPGCAPIINLFQKISDPIRLDHRQHRYPLFGDSVRQRTTEVHSVLKVTATPKNESEGNVISPFFSFRHHGSVAPNSYWVAHRQQVLQEDMPGTETQLSFVDLDYRDSLPEEKIVYAHTLCTNRNLAAQIPSGAMLQIDRASPLAEVHCLTSPTAPITPDLGSEAYWKLISHLSLNYLSLTEGAQSLSALKEILTLYASSHDPSHAKQIHGIAGLTCRRKMHHMGEDAWRGFCRGLEVTLAFDERLYVGTSALLLASVLNHFFALYTSINSFSQLVVKRTQREELWHRWPPMAGEQILL